MEKSYRQVIDENWQDYLDLLDGTLQIPSVRGQAEEGAPFGREPKRALEFVLEQAKSYGFDTKIVNDAVGYAQFGSDEDYIGILGHLDVVDVKGQDWTYPPFALSIANGRYYGRGVLDNKGPILTCLFALKLIKDLQLPLKKTIRVLFGTDEEQGSGDIPLYLAKENPPAFGFTPDCKFPVVYGERGVVVLDILTKIDPSILEQLGDFQGYMSREIVPDKLSVEYAGQIYQAQGKQAPSNAPEMAENAITLLALELKDIPYFEWLAENFHNKHFGQGLGIDFEDEESGKLALTPFFIQKEKDGIRLSVSIRYPVSISEEEVLEGLEKHLPEKSTLSVSRRFKGILFDPDSAEIRQLSQIYEEVTGMDATPVTTTGATYARFMPNILAFGPSFPGQKGIAHKEDEYMDEEDLKVITEIYLRSILALCE